jgi:hypothetical protein
MSIRDEVEKHKEMIATEQALRNHLSSVKRFKKIIANLLADIELAVGLMTPEQQETFYTTVHLANKQRRDMDARVAKAIKSEEE